MVQMQPLVAERTIGLTAIGTDDANPMLTIHANLFLQMLIVVPGIEQDVDAIARRQMRYDPVQHLLDEGCEFVKGQFGFASARAIELLDEFALETWLPHQYEFARVRVAALV